MTALYDDRPLEVGDSVTVTTAVGGAAVGAVGVVVAIDPLMRVKLDDGGVLEADEAHFILTKLADSDEDYMQERAAARARAAPVAPAQGPAAAPEGVGVGEVFSREALAQVVAGAVVFLGQRGAESWGKTVLEGALSVLLGQVDPGTNLPFTSYDFAAVEYIMDLNVPFMRRYNVTRGRPTSRPSRIYNLLSDLFAGRGITVGSVVFPGDRVAAVAAAADAAAES